MTNSDVLGGALSFIASRSDLTGGNPGVLPEAVAAATGRNRHSVLLRLHHPGAQVIDCWLSDIGFCMHTRAADGRESPGTYVPTQLAEIHLASVLNSLFTPISPTPSSGAIVIDAADLRGDRAIPPQFQAIGSAWRTAEASEPRLIVAFTHSGGLAGKATPGAASVPMQPATAAQIWAQIRQIIVGT